MIIASIELKSKDISKLLGFKYDKIVDIWCKNGKLKAYKRSHKTGWFVKGRTLIDFLYYNPKWRDQFLASEYHSERLDEIKKAILQNLSVRPRIYSTQEIADIFCVSIETVKSWVKSKWIIPIKHKPTYGGYLFDEEGIREFVNDFPRYKDVYERYLNNCLGQEV